MRRAGWVQSPVARSSQVSLGGCYFGLYVWEGNDVIKTGEFLFFLFLRIIQNDLDAFL